MLEKTRFCDIYTSNSVYFYFSIEKDRPALYLAKNISDITLTSLYCFYKTINRPIRLSKASQYMKGLKMIHWDNSVLRKEDIKGLQHEYTILDPYDYSSIYEFVTKVIKYFLNRSRYGILLGLVELGYQRGNFIGGFHLVGTNEIYLNKSALRVMRNETTADLYQAYLFHLLLHESIHAIGYSDEHKTRDLVRRISLVLFGTRHPVGKLAIFGLGAYFPYTFHEDRFYPDPSEIRNPEYILLRHRESELTYI